MEWINAKPISEEEIITVQDELGIELPQDYCTMILDINGASLASAYYEDSVLGEIPYSSNLPLNRVSKINVFEMMERFQSEQKALFPFGSVGNGDYFCFDLSTGTVVLWQHENDEINYICGSFSSLMNNLKE